MNFSSETGGRSRIVTIRTRPTAADRIVVGSSIINIPTVLAKDWWLVHWAVTPFKKWVQFQAEKNGFSTLLHHQDPVLARIYPTFLNHGPAGFLPKTKALVKPLCIQIGIINDQAQPCFATFICALLSSFQQF